MTAVSDDGITLGSNKKRILSHIFSIDIMVLMVKLELMGSLERPFLLFENGKPAYAFFGTSNGTQGFTDATDTWTVCIPLKQD